MNIDVNKYYDYVWIGASGKRRWMASGELNSKGLNYLPYGVFK